MGLIISNSVIIFFLYLCFVILIRDFGSAKRKYESRSRNEIRSPFNSFLHRIDSFNHKMQNDLKGEYATVNEVDDLGYYNDQMDIRRAWSRDDVKKEHQDKVNLHYVKLASQNAENVMMTAKCKVPTRRCLNVQKMNRDPKTYWPSCALIHTCEHDSGCCANSDHTCSHIKSNLVDLYFFSFDFSGHSKQRGRVERLTFENHTECDCRPTSMTALLESTEHEQVAEKIKSCHCPKHFKKKEDVPGCLCDCATRKSKICRRVKRGKRSYNKKGCSDPCGIPACDFGEFKEDFGRCPRKNERDKRWT